MHGWYTGGWIHPATSIPLQLAGGWGLGRLPHSLGWGQSPAVAGGAEPEYGGMPGEPLRETGYMPGMVPSWQRESLTYRQPQQAVPAGLEETGVAPGAAGVPSEAAVAPDLAEAEMAGVPPGLAGLPAGMLRREPVLMVIGNTLTRVAENQRRLAVEVRQIQEAQRATVQRLSRIDDLLTDLHQKIDRHFGRQNA